MQLTIKASGKPGTRYITLLNKIEGFLNTIVDLEKLRREQGVNVLDDNNPEEERDFEWQWKELP